MRLRRRCTIVAWLRFQVNGACIPSNFAALQPVAVREKAFVLFVCLNDTENLRWFRFISNAENLTGPQIAQLYRDRWKIELFFKKLKQNLRVQSFIGRSPNAVMNQIWGAMISVLLVDVLLRQAKYPWSFSRLFDYLSMNLLTHNNLTQIIERPNLPTEPNEASLEGVQQRLFD